MKKTTKISIGVLIGIAVLAIALLFVNNYLENRIRKAIEDNLTTANAVFDKVDVKLLDRKAEVINPYIEIKGKSLKVDTIRLNNIHLWDYVKNKDIIVGNLLISNPEVKIYNFKKASEDTLNKNKSETSSKFKNKILVKRLQLTRGSLRIFEKDSKEHRLLVNIQEVLMEEIRINAKTLKETVPFDYDLILLNADSLFYDLDKQHELSVGDLVIDNNKVHIKDLRIIPKYSKDVHQQYSKVEKDRYDLSIDSLNMSHLNWSLENDSIKIQNPFTRISGANLKVYRDKLQPDDNTTKPMYSALIRELPILLQLDSIRIANSYIQYEENIHNDRKPGLVKFSNLNASIKNLTNIGLGGKDFPETRINANADFMNAAPLSVDWSFNINNRTDQFQFSGEMGRLAAEQINTFMRPAMNVEAKGEILEMYFNFYGNGTKAAGDMRLAYKNFKVEVLRKDGERKNKFVSALANLIVKKKALNEEANYKDISYTRDKTKSFWNYVWNLVKNGALKAFL